MLRMIKAEIYKLFKSKAFKVLCGITILLIVVIVSVTSFMTKERYLETLGNIPEEEKIIQVEAIIRDAQEGDVVIPGQLGFNSNGTKDPFNVTPIEVFHTSFGIGVVEILISVLVASMFAKEYSSGTLKNTLAYGKKRYQFYIAKLISITIGISIIVALLVTIPTIITIFTKDWIGNFEISHLVEIMKTYLSAMVLYTGIISIIMLIVTIVKSKATTIAISVLVFIFVPTSLAFRYGRGDWFDKLYELSIFYNTALATAIKSTNENLLQAIAIGLLTLVVCTLLGIKVFEKQDIK